MVFTVLDGRCAFLAVDGEKLMMKLVCMSEALNHAMVLMVSELDLHVLQLLERLGSKERQDRNVLRPKNLEPLKL